MNPFGYIWITGKRRRRLDWQNRSKSRWPDRRNWKKLTPL
jgi:hypothetical protein